MKYLFFLLFTLNTLIASIIITPNSDKVRHFDIGYFYDDTRNISMEEIQNKEFITENSQFTHGFKKGDIWFKLKIKNESFNENFVVTLSEPYYSYVVLYQNRGGFWIEDKNGIDVTLQNRSLLYHTPAFNVKITKNSTKTLYIKLHSKLTTSGEIKIYTKSYFNLMSSHYTDFLYMFYFGIIFTISMFNLFLYLRLKERVYLFYSTYTFFYTLWVSAYSGHILYLSDGNFYYKFLMVTPMFIMFLILFSSEFLNVKKILPKLYKPLNIFAYTFGALALLIVVSFEPWFEVMNILASVLFLVLLGTAFLIHNKVDNKAHNKDIKYYILAITVYMLSVSLMSAMVNGWIENNDINRYSFLFASLFEIIIFTLLLTNRFYKINQELLLIKEKSEISLKQEVEKQTQDIAKMLNEKEVLLKELFHRVKNNFHLIIGILWIESNKHTDKTIFTELINKIKSMSKINDYLYKAKDINSVNANDYLSDIVRLSSTLDINKNVQLSINIEDIYLSFQDALNLGIIINEILTNSIKHNQDLEKIKIKITFTKVKDIYSLEIQDNGKEFNKNNQDKGVGLALINDFSKKLNNSTHQFLLNNGTLFSLKFEKNTHIN